MGRAAERMIGRLRGRKFVFSWLTTLKVIVFDPHVQWECSICITLDV